ncbi:MAG: hypothetical protein NTV86_22995 [Planctomycetota bacterium]|nr:hypothetical protein [Planctomycetota bacterium]
MRTITTLTAMLALAGALVGCQACSEMPAITANLAKAGLAHGPDQRRQLEKKLTDQDISDLLDVRVQAKLPTSLAVAKVGCDYSGAQPHLADFEPGEFDAWEKALRGVPKIRGVQPVTPLAIGTGTRTPSLYELRTAAARLNCELLLVYLQADASGDTANDAAALYWTIIGLWTAPGDTLEHRTLMQAVVLDCRTGMILGTAVGDKQIKKDCPAAFVSKQHTELAKQATAEALAQLQQSATRAMTALATAAR